MDNARLVETRKSQLIYSSILNRKDNYKISQKYLPTKKNETMNILEQLRNTSRVMQTQTANIWQLI